MSISWRTGEPPRGVELLIEFEYEGNGRRMVSILDDEVLTRICILRWSTLDDDRAAKAMGALESHAISRPNTFILIDFQEGVGFRAIEPRYVDVGYDEVAEATSLIEAIGKLTENGNDSR